VRLGGFLGLWVYIIAGSIRALVTITIAVLLQLRAKMEIEDDKTAVFLENAEVAFEGMTSTAFLLLTVLSVITMVIMSGTYIVTDKIGDANKKFLGARVMLLASEIVPKVVDAFEMGTPLFKQLLPLTESMPDAYLVPLDSDEFLGYFGPERPLSGGGAQVDAWRIQFDRHGLLDSFSECQQKDQRNHGRPGYYSMNGLNAQLCNESLYEKGRLNTRLARTNVIDPHDVDMFLRRYRRGCCGESSIDKKFVRAGNWNNYGMGGHALNTMNRASFSWSRIVAVHYGSLTKAQLAQKMEGHFVQTHWYKKLGLSLEQVRNVSHINAGRCRGSAFHYCMGLISLHRGEIKFTPCKSTLVSRGTVLMRSP